MTVRHALSLATLLLVTACSATPTAPTSAVSTPTATTATKAAAATSSVTPAASSPTAVAAPTLPASRKGRHFEKTLGAQTGLMNNAGGWLVKYTVTKVQADFACTAPDALAPANGHYVAITIEASAASAADGAQPVRLDSAVAVSQDKAFVLAGQGNAATCVKQADRLPTILKPGESAKGVLVIDVPVVPTWVSTSLSDDSGADWWWPVG